MAPFFESLEWKYSEKGNPYTNWDKWNLVVFNRARMKKDGTRACKWSYRTQRRSPTEDPSCTVAPINKFYESEIEAKLAAYNSVLDLEERLK